MSIEFGKRWVSANTGEPMAAVSVTHVITRGMAAALLACHAYPVHAEDLRELSKREVEAHIRAQLKADPAKADWWADDYAEEYAHEVTSGQVGEWARRQVDKL